MSSVSQVISSPVSQQRLPTKFFLPVDYNINNNDYYNPTDWNSLFIPSLPPIFVDEDILTWLIQEVFVLGSVKRVDIIKKENVNNRLMAFIHFNYWFKNSSTILFREKLENDGSIDIFGYVNFHKSATSYTTLLGNNVKKDTFLRFLINKTPIKDTELNIHQLADLLEKADDKITEQDLLIKKLKKELLDTQLLVENLNTRVVSLENIINDVDEDILSGEEDQSEETVSELNDNLSEEKIEKPKLVRECYINECYDEASMVANCYSELSLKSSASLY